MDRLITESQEKRLKVYVPKWAELLADGKIDNGLQSADPNVMDMGYDDSCLTAEVYGFTNEYCMLSDEDYCLICTEFSLTFSITVGSGKKGFKRAITQFLEHIEEHHTDLIKQTHSQ